MSATSRSASFFLLLSMAVGCGGVVRDAQEGAASSGAGGTSAQGSTGEGAGTVGSVGAGGSTTVSAGVGGGPACYETHDGVEITLATYDGKVLGCSGAALGDVVMNGAIVSGSENAWEIDSCPPNADCLPMISKLSVAAPDLYVYLPIGAYVEVHVVVDQPWGCTQAIQIKNLPSWGGVPNPAAFGDMLWVAAADGVATPLAGAPFGIEPVPLGCYPNEMPGCGQHEDYLLRFSDASGTGSPIDVSMGQTAELAAKGGAEYWMVRNLRSYETGFCDDYWNWGYWVAPQMFDTGGED